MTNSKDIRRITPEEIEQQKQYCREIKKLFEGRPGGPPLAYTQTFGCQQNVADSQRIMGMLRDMG